MFAPAHLHDVLVASITSIVIAFLTIDTAIHAVKLVWRGVRWCVLRICLGLRECAEEIADGLPEIAKEVSALRHAVAKVVERIRTTLRSA